MRRHIVRLVARRELRERARTRSFLLATALLLVAAVAGGLIPAFLDDDKHPVDVGVVTGAQSTALASALQSTSAASGHEINVTELASVAEGDAALKRGDLDVVVTASDGLRLRGERTSDAVQDFARGLAAAVPLHAVLESSGVAPDRLATAGSLPVEAVEPEREDPGARDAVWLGGFVLYMALMGYGNWVAAGVLEEKASRVVEVVLSAVRPSELLAGKILGIGVLGLGQMVLVGGAGLIAALAAGVDLPPSAPQAIALVVLWFGLGFAFYSCAFAALGAAASRQEDAQAAMSPVIALLVGGFVLSMFVQSNPDGALARITPFIPPLAPMTAPARVILGHPQAWEVVTSVVLMLVASYALIRLGARAYGGAVLRFGAKLSVQELWTGARVGRARSATDPS